MRKRVVKDPGTQAAPATFEKTPCPACGLKQSRDAAPGGKCIRCGEDMEFGPANETRVSSPQGALATPKALDPSGSFQKPAAGQPEAPVREPENLSMLAHVLQAQGYDFNLADLAQMEAHERRRLADYAAGKTDKPDILVRRDEERRRAEEATGAPQDERPRTSGAMPPRLVDLIPRVTNVLTASPDAPETVRYEWGEESIQLAPFSTVRVGPFASTTNVLAGETREQALSRLRDQVVAFAEGERKRKIRSYLDALKWARAEAKGE